MPTDYEELRQDPKVAARNAVRRLMRLYSEKVHFVYEFLQNADDAVRRDRTDKQVCLAFMLRERELLVWNDGRPFDRNDIRGICSIGESNKDLTQIGTFGIGFKAVYVYTDLPEVYSGDKRFRIHDYLEPKALDEVPPDIYRWVEEGKTVFRLPFKERIRREDVERLRGKLRDLGLRSLLFLRHLRRIKWDDGNEMGSYRSERHDFEPTPNAQRVVVSAEASGQESGGEEWVVFSTSATPPPEVIRELLNEADDEEEKKRIQSSAYTKQPIDIAFKWQDGSIVPADRCKLFAYLPTEKETYLRFLIQARYQTTPARDNVPTDSPWNAWLVQETADFLHHVLQQLKDAGLLTPSFFDVLPLDEDNVPELFQPIEESLKNAIRAGEFIPTAVGNFKHPTQVFHPHAKNLRTLLTDQDLAELTEVEGAAWLTHEIDDTERHRRRFAVVKAAGIGEVNAGRLVTWLANKGEAWLKDKSAEWLHNLCAYLHGVEGQHTRLQSVPLIRLENGEQVNATSRSVFFPPESDEEHQEYAPFLSELNVVSAAMLGGEHQREVKAFLERMGVKRLRHADVIRACVLPKYKQTPLPTHDVNRLHLRYLKGALDEVASGDKPQLLTEIRQTWLLLTRKGVKGEELSYVEPSRAYLPQAYTGSRDLEIYFAPCSEVWFVDKGYLTPDDKAEEWCKFLKELDCADLPRIEKRQIRKSEVGWDHFRVECNKRNIATEYSTRDEIIEEPYIDGLSQALSEISKSKDKAIAQAVWRLLVNLLPRNQWERNSFFRGSYSWFHYSSKYKRFDAIFYCQLRMTNWLPDEHGNFHQPSELFAPTAENRRLLGDSVHYVHPDFDVTDKPVNEPGRCLAQQLGIHLNADTASVLKYLRSLSGNESDVKTIEPLYRFLDRQEARPRAEFQEEALIFTLTPQPRWWRAHEVFWEDESAVFGEQRGYLKAVYAESLKPFFIAVGVAERAAPLDYVRAIRELAEDGNANDEALRSRLKQ